MSTTPALTVGRRSFLFNDELVKGAAGAGTRPEIASQHIARDLFWQLQLDPSTTETMDTTTAAELLSAALDAPESSEISRWACLDETIFSPIFVDGDPLQVLLPGAMASAPFDGDCIVFLPTRSCAIMVPANRADAVSRAAALVEFFYDAQDLLSFQPLIGRDGSWSGFNPTPDHLAYDACARLEVLDRVAIERAQREILVSVVAPAIEFGALQVLVSGSALWTVCTWNQGTETLLPEADAIRFSSAQDEPPMIVKWDAAISIVGERMLRTGHEPARWLTSGYPSPGELAALSMHQERLGEE